MQAKIMIFVFMFVLVIMLVYGPAITYSVPNESNNAARADCKSTGKQSQNGLALVKCCWKTTEGYPGLRKEVTYCSTCEDGGTRGKINCSDPVKEFTGRLPDEILSPQDSVLEQPTISGEEPPITGQQILPQDELVQQQEQPPVEDQEEAAPQFAEPSIVDDEESQPQVAEPVCPQDQVFDEEIGLCILEEPEDQSTNGEEQQSSEGDDGSDENNN
jgi:hypothetical protein